MRKAGVQPTATSYFKLINGAFRHDEADVAFAALSRMIEVSILSIVESLPPTHPLYPTPGPRALPFSLRPSLQRLVRSHA